MYIIHKVMCHLSMKLSDRFDPNQMSTSDKIVVKHISVKETLLRPVHTRQLSCMQLIPCNMLPRVDRYVAQKKLHATLCDKSQATKNKLPHALLSGNKLPEKKPNSQSQHCIQVEIEI